MDIDKISEDIAVTYWGKEGEASFAQIVNRVVDYVCAKWKPEDREEMRDLMMKRAFLPNSPCWMNAGTHMKSLAACFVLPLEDSMESIFNTARDMAMVFKEGGGVGVALSPLRPDGSVVHTTKGVSSGPISFLKVFDAIIAAVRQGGTRRGAAMAGLIVHHPDIMSFIRCKTKEGEIENFNISVALTDEFMDAYISGKTEFKLRHPKLDKEITIDPKEIMDAIVDGMWRNGEPGVQFIDTVNTTFNEYTVQYKRFLEGISASNPCGETFLLPNESCILGAINMYIVHKLGLNLKRVVELAVDFLNEVIDLSEAPLPKINEATRASRKIGLGVMGLADYLSVLALDYSKGGARSATEVTIQRLNEYARARSIEKKYENATLTLVAPTGTTGVVGGVSGGIEPHFRLMYTRNSVKLGKLDMLCRSLYDFMEEHPEMKPHMMKELMENNGKFKSEKWKGIWPTADQIAPMDHLKMMATVQRNVDNSVSKTINLPATATREEIRNLILEAHRLKIKGFTVYRDTSRDVQVLEEIKVAAIKVQETAPEPASETIGCESCNGNCHTASKIDRPIKTTGETVKTYMGCGSLYVTVNADKDGPCEVFTNLGRSGGCPSQSEATARLVSLALRSGVPVPEVIDQLKGIRCLSTIAGKTKGKQPDGTRVLSCPDAIGKRLEEVYKESLGPVEVSTKEMIIKDLKGKYEDMLPPTTVFMNNECPSCSCEMTLNEGCRICMSCGYSKCG